MGQVKLNFFGSQGGMVASWQALIMVVGWLFHTSWWVARGTCVWLVTAEVKMHARRTVVKLATAPSVNHLESSKQSDVWPQIGCCMSGALVFPCLLQGGGGLGYWMMWMVSWIWPENQIHDHHRSGHTHIYIYIHTHTPLSLSPEGPFKW